MSTSEDYRRQGGTGGTTTTNVDAVAQAKATAAQAKVDELKVKVDAITAGQTTQDTSIAANTAKVTDLESRNVITAANSTALSQAVQAGMTDTQVDGYVALLDSIHTDDPEVTFNLDWDSADRELSGTASNGETIPTYVAPIIVPGTALEVAEVVMLRYVKADTSMNLTTASTNFSVIGDADLSDQSKIRVNGIKQDDSEFTIVNDSTISLTYDLFAGDRIYIEG